MARIARVVIPGIPHHITQRGVRSMKIFFDPGDRSEYLELLRHHSRRHHLHFADYCLMSNHVHLIAIPEREDSLRRAVGEAHRLYTRMINFRTGKRGYLFQGRFFSCPLDDEHLLAALRYVERNPVRAGMVTHAWDHPWSGAKLHVGLTSTDPLIDVDTMALVHLRHKDWPAFLAADPLVIDTLREKTRTGRPCGNKTFVAQLERITGRILHPLRPGPARESP